VLWASAGRGPATQRRAQAADLTDVGTLPELIARSQLNASWEWLRVVVEEVHGQVS
jgi:hypothetical protein